MSEKEIKLLGEVPIFQKASKETLKKIAPLVETVKFEDGAVVFAEGSMGDALYILVQGEVAVVKTLSGAGKKKAEGAAKEKVLATLQKGDFFGEMALLDEAARSATARAKGAVTALKIGRKNFWDYVRSDAEAALQTILFFARTMSDRLRLTTMELATVFELGKIFSSGLKKPDLAGQITEQMKAVLPDGAHAGLALWNEFNEEFEWAAVTQKETFPAELRRNLSRTEPIPAFLEKERAAFASENWKEEPRFKPEEKNLYGAHGGTVLAVPMLKTQDARLLPSGHWLVSCPLLGFLFCVHPGKPAAFDRQLVHLLNTIANLSATALENAAHVEEENARNDYAQRRQTIV